MIFMSRTFAGGKRSIATTPPDESKITSVMLSNGVFDKIYISRNTNKPLPLDEDDSWDGDTVLHAKFNGNTYAGNLEIDVENLDGFVIKRRFKDEFEWQPLYKIPLENTGYVHISIPDYTVRANTLYEYAIVPVSGTVEGGYVTNEITPCFSGLFIVERDRVFSTDLNVNFYPVSANKPTEVIMPLNRKYPFVVSNSGVKFDSGNISALFLEHSNGNYNFDNYGVNQKNSWKYRKLIDEFLYNGNPKLIKYEDGQAWLVSISSSSIDKNQTGVIGTPVETTFGWTEIGDCDKSVDLYKYGFTDIY